MNDELEELRRQFAEDVARAREDEPIVTESDFVDFVKRASARLPVALNLDVKTKRSRSLPRRTIRVEITFPDHAPSPVRRLLDWTRLLYHVARRR